MAFPGEMLICLVAPVYIFFRSSKSKLCLFKVIPSGKVIWWASSGFHLADFVWKVAMKTRPLDLRINQSQYSGGIWAAFKQIDGGL